MGKPESITIREVEPADLETFYEHQLDPGAVRMAGFVGRNRTEKAAFAAHWEKILHAPETVNRTIVAGGRVAGYVACFPDGEKKEVTYWLGREFWGRGFATEALGKLLELVRDRPLFATAVADNIGSIKVLQKCGFKLIGTHKEPADDRGEATEECILRLDAEEATEEANPAPEMTRGS